MRGALEKVKPYLQKAAPFASGAWQSCRRHTVFSQSLFSELWSKGEFETLICVSQTRLVIKRDQHVGVFATLLLVIFCIYIFWGAVPAPAHVMLESTQVCLFLGGSFGVAEPSQKSQLVRTLES